MVKERERERETLGKGKRKRNRWRGYDSEGVNAERIERVR